MTNAIEGVIGSDQTCQVFCVLMLDGDVETYPGSGKYSSNVEGKAVSVTGLGSSNYDPMENNL